MAHNKHKRKDARQQIHKGDAKVARCTRALVSAWALGSRSHWLCSRARQTIMTTASEQRSLLSRALSLFCLPTHKTVTSICSFRLRAAAEKNCPPLARSLLARPQTGSGLCVSERVELSVERASVHEKDKGNYYCVTSRVRD